MIRRRRVHRGSRPGCAARADRADHARRTGIRVQVAGEGALVVEYPGGIGPRTYGQVRRLDVALQRHQTLGRLPAGVQEWVPAYRSVTVYFDPLAARPAAIRAWLRQVAASVPGGPPPAGRVVTIPVCYGGEYGPDLADVSRSAGLAAEEVIRLHASARYRVYMLGFMPGFAYLGGLPPQIACPRLPTPRAAVPAGSVGIAGHQTGLYSLQSPGGWRIIGRTPVRLWDPRRNPPALLAPGDEIRFQRVTVQEFARLSPVPEEQSPADSTGPPPRNGGPVHAGHGPGAPVRDGGPAILVEAPGMLTTVQDLGRPGWQRYGIPPGGALDPFALRAANLLAGNPEDAAGLEITWIGPRLRFLAPAVIALAGADLGATLDGTPLPPYRAVAVRRGSMLRFGKPREGVRAYLAVRGGIGVPPVLGSRSTYLRAGLGGLAGRALKKGDLLPIQAPPPAARQTPPPPSRPAASRSAGACGPCREAPAPPARETLAPRPGLAGVPSFSGAGVPPGGEAATPIRVVLGPQAHLFTAESIRRFLDGTYTITPASDRMGCRLQGPRLQHRRGADVISDAVPAGSTQVAGDGQPIVMLADRQTTGGYTKIATVIAADLPVLAQLAPGAAVRWQAVAPEQAVAALREREAELARFRISVPGAAKTAAAASGDRGESARPGKSHSTGPARIGSREIERILRALARTDITFLEWQAGQWRLRITRASRRPDVLS
ncbi:MAG: 5-oxoprolinase subunit PxpB [Firmicutes bacterium]|nr:5-oxoprolinase subunit PxpB [Bacillota bacterium]